MPSAKKANRSYFRQAYLSGEHGWATDAASPDAVAFLRRLKRIVPDGVMLDVGCGEGRHAIAAAKLGFKVTAIDYEALALRRARRFAQIKQARGIVFRKADVLRLPFRRARFDVVLDYGCLHHQPKADWPAYKAGILRILKADGFYILSVFSPMFALFRNSRRPWHVAQGAYRRCFTAADIKKLFGRDFQILDLRLESSGRGFWHTLMRRRSRPAIRKTAMQKGQRT